MHCCFISLCAGVGGIASLLRTRDNKSLDAGGGSVFLKMIGPAMLD